MTSRMFILAGEASGDVLAAQLMQAVEQIKGPVDWTGMGGPEMTAAGLTSAEEMSQLSVIGLGEALTALPRLSRLADRLIDRVLDTRPDIVFTVDSKAFSVRFARRLRRRLGRLRLCVRLRRHPPAPSWPACAALWASFFPRHHG